jgi:hypothetical protein
MKIRTVATSLTLFSLFSATAEASDINMNPGMWQWTAVMEMPGMPMQLPPTSYTTCISKADFIPKDSQLGQTCETIDLKTEGDKVSWNMTCTQAAGVTRSQGSITYYGDSAEGVVLIDNQGMQMS